MKTIKVKITNEVPELLAVLDERRNVKNVLLSLIDHAQQGVYRPGAWEREWICQAIGYDWLERTQPNPARPMFEIPVKQETCKP